MSKAYTPSQKLIDNYADVLVNFALNSGEGLKKGEVVQAFIPDVAKPLALALQNTILKSGGHPMIQLIPTGFDKDFYQLANSKQLTFFPRKYLKERVKLLDHQISIIADIDPRELTQVPPQKILKSINSKKPYRDWRNDKENRGKFTWTIGLWGVQAKADEVNLSLKDYWQQIARACFLDKPDPIKEWKKIFVMQQKIRTKLNKLHIEWLDIKGQDVDLKIQLGANRIWNGGSGRNIPSFEFFTSPCWHGTKGWIKFNQPLYRYGNVIKDIYLEFNEGVIVKAHARKGNKFLQEMIKTKNANKLGEYSLTDKRMSRITHAMAETLYDENIGGPFGNTHLAVGMSYQDCYRGDPSKPSKEDWHDWGFNDSAEHTDMVSTTDRTVIATLTNGKKQVIYQDGMFVL